MFLGGLIGAAIGAIGSIASAAFSIASTIGSVVLAIQGIKAVVSAIVNICKELGLIQEETEPENLGDKAIQAEEAGITPEKFDSYEKYVKAVEEFEIDPEKSKNISETDKQLKAAELASGLLLEKMPGLTQNTLESIITSVGKDPEKLAAIFKSIDVKNDGAVYFDNISGVLTNALKDPDKYASGIKALIGVEKSINPDIDDKQAQKNVMETIKNAQK